MTGIRPVTVGPIRVDTATPSSPSLVELGAGMRSARVVSGLTQDDLAAAEGLNRKTVSRVELGRHAVSVVGLMAMAKTLGVRPACSWASRSRAADTPRAGRHGTQLHSRCRSVPHRAGDGPLGGRPPEQNRRAPPLKGTCDR